MALRAIHTKLNMYEPWFLRGRLCHVIKLVNIHVIGSKCFKTNTNSWRCTVVLMLDGSWIFTWRYTVFDWLLSVVCRRGLDQLWAPGGWIDRNMTLGREGMFDLIRRGSVSAFVVDCLLPSQLHMFSLIDPFSHLKIIDTDVTYFSIHRM